MNREAQTSGTDVLPYQGNTAPKSKTAKMCRKHHQYFSPGTVVPAYHWRTHLLPAFCLQLVRTPYEGIEMPSVYESWVGTPVVLQVSAGELRVPLRGTIIGENGDAVRFRVGDGWDIDVFKNMIMAVEEDNWASIVSS